MSEYLREFSTRETPQSEPLPGQVSNSAGGHAWAVDDWARLQRFLVLGSEGGSYYATQRALTKENAQGVLRCIATHTRPRCRRRGRLVAAGRRRAGRRLGLRGRRPEAPTHARRGHDRRVDADADG